MAASPPAVVCSPRAGSGGSRSMPAARAWRLSRSSRRTASSQSGRRSPRRWVIERTLGRLMHHRHLARDDETLPHRFEAMIHLAMIDLANRRLARESTPNWRDT
ncbi:hypothetical protein GCM10010405_23840 [Streptomyces macrosporus]|uniref:Transposase n=1 Tax=Streptomyces macrosporus TaxID=44032 RepID=A0ABN3JT22_9ACTN